MTEESIDELFRRADAELDRFPDAPALGAKRAADLLAAALAESPGDLRLAAKTMMYMRFAGELREATAIGRSLYRDDLTDTTFLRSFGTSLRASGHWREAAQAHRRVAQLTPEDDDAKYSLVLSEAQYGFPAIALPIIEELSASKPDHVKLEYGRAFVLSRLGRYRAAIDVLERYLARVPQSVDGWLLLAEVARALGWRDRWKNAVGKVFDRLQPATREMWRAFLALDDRRPADAIEALMRATKLDETFGEAYSELGALLFAMGSLTNEAELIAKADEVLEVACDLLPDDGVARGRWLELRVADGRGLDALDEARKAAEDRPHAGLPRYLARIFAGFVGDFDLAERWYRAWLSTCEEDVGAWQELVQLLDALGRSDDAAEARARADALRDPGPRSA